MAEEATKKKKVEENLLKGCGDERYTQTHLIHNLLTSVLAVSSTL